MAHGGRCVLSAAYGPVLIPQRRAGGLALQALPVPLETAGTWIPSDITLSPEQQWQRSPWLTPITKL